MASTGETLSLGKKEVTAIRRSHETQAGGVAVLNWSPEWCWRPGLCPEAGKTNRGRSSVKVGSRTAKLAQEENMSDTPSVVCIEFQAG